MRKAITRAFLGILLVVSAAAAHEQSLHRGHPTEGEVVSISGEKFMLKTSKETVPVTVSETTRFERGAGEATKEDLQPGEHVSVFGTTLASGEIVAREILIHPAGGEREHHGGHVQE